MWEMSRHLSRRGNSIRQILTYALTAFIAAFLLVLASNLPVAAASSARWEGSDIIYEGATYQHIAPNASHPPIIPDDKTTYFLYSEIDSSGAGQDSIIYFDKGTNMRQSNTANLAVYAVDGNGNYGAKLSGPEQIAILPTTLDSSSSQATWSEGNLRYDGKTYEGESKGGPPLISDGSAPLSLPNGAQYFQILGEPDASGNGTLYIIYFPANADLQTANKATYVTYSVDGSGNPVAKQASKSIDVVPLQTLEDNGITDAGKADAEASTCNVPGIGWIVCPISNFLAWGMDNIFHALTGFFEVAPLSTDTEGGMYTAWNYIRSFANIAFVIVFLIIIYSQLTNMGLSNYGLKRLIPRLIIAAVLVNISYYICAIAVDLSNIFGQSLYSLLTNMRADMGGANTNDIASWESVTGLILSVGTGVTAGAVALGGVTIASGASLGAALILLIPMLLSLLLAVLVALVVLAVRQALIIILIIVAPLAFVAYLLPNTEKWFENWRKLLTTLLMLFPLFALVFGGSQLAASLIIQTASGSNAMTVILLALFVQVAPLFITPMLVKFSGSLVGRIVNIVNNPSKGLIDRTRNWSKEQSEYLAARNMARRDPVRQRQVFRRFALGADHEKRRRQDYTAAYKEASDAQWTNTHAYSDIQQELRYAQDEKAAGTAEAGLRYENAKSIHGGQVQHLDMRARELKLQTDNATAQANINWEGNHAAPIVEQRMLQNLQQDQLSALHATHTAQYEEMKAGRAGTLPRTAQIAAMTAEAEQTSRRLAIDAMRAESAKRASTQRFTEALERNTDRIDGQLMQTYAGGIQGQVGAQRALAAAISAQAKAQSEARLNADAIVKHSNLGDNIIGKIALGHNVSARINITDDIRLAAAQHIASGSNATEINNLIRDIVVDQTPATLDMRQTLYDAFLSNSNRPKYLSVGQLAQLKQGIMPLSGKARLDQLAAEAINADKFSSAETLVSQDKEFLNTVRDALINNQSTTPIDPAAARRVHEAIIMARTQPLYAGKIGERHKVLEEIERLLP